MLGKAFDIFGHSGVAHDVGVGALAVVAGVDSVHRTLRHVKNFLQFGLYVVRTA